MYVVTAAFLVVKVLGEEEKLGKTGFSTFPEIDSTNDYCVYVLISQKNWTL